MSKFQVGDVVVVVGSDKHRADRSQRYVGQTGIVDTLALGGYLVHVRVGTVRVCCHADELELVPTPVEVPENHGFVIGGWAERTSHPYAEVKVGTRREVVAIQGRGIRTRGANGLRQTWGFEYCRPCDGPGVPNPALQQAAERVRRAHVREKEAAKALEDAKAAHTVAVLEIDRAGEALVAVAVRDNLPE